VGGWGCFKCTATAKSEHSNTFIPGINVFRYHRAVRELTDTELAGWIDTAAKSAQRLKEAFAAEEIYVANVATSFVPFSHLTKAFQVHEAVLVLCRAGFGAEAFALSRVLLEMYITLRWITNQDQNKRAEEFAFFVAKRKEYAAKVFAKYRPGSAVAADAVKFVETTYKQYADRYDSFKFWSNKPNNLRALAEEKEILIAGLVAPDDDSVMLYELPYSMASDYVHVTALALDAVFPTTGVPYRAEGKKEPRRTLDAVFESTQWLFYMAVRVDAYRQAGLQSEIDATYKEFANLVDEL
jgi:hypothetical protein